MKRFKRMAALLMAVSVVLSGCAGVELPEDAEENEVVELPPARAQDDFFRYINEQELENAEFGYGEMAYRGGFKSTTIEDQVKEIISEVASGSGYETGSEEYIIKRAYDLFYAYDFENSGVPAELDALFHEIDEISTIEEFMEMDARLDKDYFVGNVFNFYRFNFAVESLTNILCFGIYNKTTTEDIMCLQCFVYGIS